MNLLQQTRQTIADRLFINALERHRSRMGRKDAPRYTAHWEACRKAMRDPLPPAGELAPSIEAFARDGVTSFHTAQTGAIAQSISARIAAREAAGETVWLDDPRSIGNNRYAGETWRDFPELEGLFRGPLGTFLEHYFGCHFRIWFALLYRNAPRNEARVGSQRWHSDAGPGSCVNVMFYLDETTPQNGPLEALPWPQALEVFRGERAALRASGGPRETGGDRNGALYDHYEQIIAARYAANVVQPAGPAGLVVPFLNNTIHRGGFPAPGYSRTAMVFHCYPGAQPTPFDLYRERGLAKPASYPRDPGQAF